MTGDWEDLFPTVHVHEIPRECSDHNPLILSTKQRAIKRQRMFRFELPWLKDVECLKRIQELWEEPTRDNEPLDRVQFKLKKVKKFLKG
jgi:hypothetical protein